MIKIYVQTVQKNIDIKMRPVITTVISHDCTKKDHDYNNQSSEYDSDIDSADESTAWF